MEIFCSRDHPVMPTLVRPPPMSYANVNDMLAKRWISVHRSTIYCWFIEYAPILRQKLKRYQFTHVASMKPISKSNGIIHIVPLAWHHIRFLLFA